MAFDSAHAASMAALPHGHVDSYFSQDVDEDVVTLSAEETDQYTLLPPHAMLPRAILLRLDDASGRSCWAEERQFSGDTQNWCLLHPGALEVLRARYQGEEQDQGVVMEEAEEDVEEEPRYSYEDPIEAEEFNKVIEVDEVEVGNLQDAIYEEDRVEQDVAFGDRRTRNDSRLIDASHQSSDLATFNVDENAGEVVGDGTPFSPNDGDGEGDDEVQNASQVQISKKKQGKMPMGRQPFGQPTPVTTPTPSQPQSIDLNAEKSPYRGTSTIPVDLLAICRRIQAQILPSRMSARAWLGNPANCSTEFVKGGFIAQNSRLWQFWMDMRLFEGRVWWYLATRNSRPFPRLANPTAQADLSSIQQALSRDGGWDRTRIYSAPSSANSANSSVGPAATGARPAKRQRTG